MTTLSLNIQANELWQKAWRLLAPATKPVTPTPARNFESIELSRHDHHNLEVKMMTQSSDGALESELEVFLFVPGSFQLARWGKAELQADFRSRLRLAVPLQPDEGLAAIDEAMRLLRGTLEGLGRSESRDDSELLDQLAELTKEVGAVVGETLKQASARHRRRLLLAHALTADLTTCLNELRCLPGALNAVAATMAALRELLNEARTLPMLTLLDEFLSHLYVQYLATLRGALADIEIPSDRYQVPSYFTERGELERVLTGLQRAEADYRRKFEHAPERARDAAERELQMIRISQLKKFFQSRMFMDVARRNPRKRMMESTATLGAVFAGIWNIFMRRWDRAELLAFSSQGLALAGIGVFAYVMRDRIKDWTREKANHRAAKWLPDCAQQLVAEGRSIGVIREWFGLLKPKAVPAGVRALRLRACRTEVERGLPEEVFHYRRRQTIQSAPVTGPRRWAVQESLRINVERYLKHMDDPFKELAVLDPTGELVRFRSRRVYDFYVGIRGVSATGAPESARLYRVVLHKKGIDRVEEII